MNDLTNILKAALAAANASELMENAPISNRTDLSDTICRDYWNTLWSARSDLRLGGTKRALRELCSTKWWHHEDHGDGT